MESAIYHSPFSPAFVINFPSNQRVTRHMGYVIAMMGDKKLVKNLNRRWFRNRGSQAYIGVHLRPSAAREEG